MGKIKPANNVFGNQFEEGDSEPVIAVVVPEPEIKVIVPYKKPVKKIRIRRPSVNKMEE